MGRRAKAWRVALVCLVAPACSSKPFSAGSSDASSALDGTTDMGLADGETDAGSPADPCDASPPHTLCDTFDQSDKFAPWWSQPSRCSPAVVGVSEAVTPPHDELAQLVEGGTQPCSEIATALPVPDGGVAHCEFDVRYDDMPPSYFAFFVIGAQDTAATFSYEIDLQHHLGAAMPITVGEVFDPYDAGQLLNSAALASPFLNDWHHVSFEFDLANRVARVAFDNGAQQTLSLQYLPPAIASMEVALGVTWQGQSLPTKVRVDEVWCDVP